MVESRCAVCNIPASMTCGGCNGVYYCSREHQKRDWKSHKSACKVYIVAKNEIMGRYVVAAKDIPAGSVIMNEGCLMIGPKQYSLPICLGCHKNLKDHYHYCSKCSLPLCSEKCEELEIHKDNECKIFAKKKVFKVQSLTEHHPIYQCIMTLRCLLLKDKDNKKWQRLNKMEHHNSLRKENKALWHRNENNTVKLLTEVYGLDFDPETIHTVLGFADINAFEIKTDDVAICGIFPDVALMAHDCVSNTHHAITEDYRMVVRSSVDIKKGDLITTTYTHTLEGTMERREHILQSKLFSCGCSRCASPTEFGTNFSSVRCQNKSNQTSIDIPNLQCPGYLTPRNPLEFSSIWQCDTCSNTLDIDKIKFTLEQIRLEIEDAEKNKNQVEVAERLEELLKMNSGIVLHENHYLMVGIWITLSQFYGRTKGHVLTELSLEKLERKELLCRKLLTILDVLEPGLSRIRGLTLYELHAAVFFSTKVKYDAELIDRETVKARLLETINLLEISQRILGFDSLSSSHGRIAASIPSSLENVKEIYQYFA